MLQTSQRKPSRQRERGISLSRNSSIQRLSQIPFKNNCITSNNISSLQNQENKQNRLSLQPKYHSIKPKNNERSALKNSHRQNQSLMVESSQLFQQAESISHMIQLLVQYEKVCQQKMDLISAEQARKKINELRKQEHLTRRKEIQAEEKSQVIKTRRQLNLEWKEFQEFWEHKIIEVDKALKQIQQSHLADQQTQYEQFEKSIANEPNLRIKYSSKVLQIRRNLSSLIKSRKYKQAQHLKSILQKKQIEQQQKWQIVCEQKKKNRLKQFKKKQLQEYEALKLKLKSSFNQLIKEKQKQEEKMKKKMKKKEIESNKIPSSLLRAKTNLLNESKAKIDDKEQF